MGFLAGRVAVITGSTRGLGYAIAEKFCAEGARVILSGRSELSVQNAVQSFTRKGYEVFGVAGDIAQSGTAELLLSAALSHYQRMDVWVNNAGITGTYGPSVEIPPEEFISVQKTNLFGTYFGSITALDHFLPQQQGKLINILGRGYRKEVPYQNAYSASKIWVRSFTLALAAENKQSGVGIFAFNPGMVTTELLTDIQVVDGYQDRLKAFPFIVRVLAKPASIPAAKAAWIASSATDGITGKIITTPDNGRVAINLIRELRNLVIKNRVMDTEIKMSLISRRLTRKE